MANVAAAVRPASRALTPRSDPRPRHTDAASVWDKTTNRDPKKHYVLAYKGNPETGVEYYRSLGYEAETLRPDGPRLRGGQTVRPGEEIEMRGHVLMSIDWEKRQLLEQEGPDGMTGQRHIDELEAKIVRRRSMADMLRGIRGIRGTSGEPVAELFNETSALEPDLPGG